MPTYNFKQEAEVYVVSGGTTQNTRNRHLFWSDVF